MRQGRGNFSQPFGDGGRDWGDTAMSPELLRLWQSGEAGEILLEPSEEAWPCETWERTKPAVLGPPLVLH